MMDWTGFIKEHDETLSLNQKTLNDTKNEPIITGVAYIDDKIKNRELSVYEAYLANKYLGIDFGNFASARLKADVKQTNLTQTTKELGLMLNALANSEEVLKRSNKTGTWNGLLTWLNQASNGFIGLDEERAKLHAAGLQTAYAAADAMNNGKATNESRREARETFGVGFRDQDEVVARTAQAREAMLNRIESLLADLQAKGGNLELNKSMATEILKQRAKQDYLNYRMHYEDNGNFDYEKYQNSIYQDFSDEKAQLRRLKK